MTLQLANETLLQQLKQISYQVQRSPEQIILEALQLYMKQKEITPLPSFWLAIIGLGSSDETDVARRDEEIFQKEIDPIKGWHVPLS